MKIKKSFDDIIVYFDILGNKLSIDSDELLKNIITSVKNSEFIFRHKPFNELVKEQQKCQFYILVDFEPTEIDSFKFITKIIYNFLIVTNQHKSFMLDKIIIPYNENEIIIYGTEIFNWYEINIFTYSPSIRAQWENPKIIEEILKK